MIPHLVRFVSPRASAGVRLTPAELKARAAGEGGAGTFGVSGIRTRILNGDPTGHGLYTIHCTVPANVRIEAHDHPDERAATVVSGTWYFGYGARFDDSALKALPPGSFLHRAAQPAALRAHGRRPRGPPDLGHRTDRHHLHRPVSAVAP